MNAPPVTARTAHVLELHNAEGESIGLFEVVSRWEGMLKLRAIGVVPSQTLGQSLPRGVLIVEDPFSGAVGMITQLLEQEAPLQIVKASPEIVDALAASEKRQREADEAMQGRQVEVIP